MFHVKYWFESSWHLYLLHPVHDDYEVKKQNSFRQRGKSLKVLFMR